MSILENLRNLGEDALEQNLKAFNIKSTGNIDEVFKFLNELKAPSSLDRLTINY